MLCVWVCVCVWLWTIHHTRVRECCMLESVMRAPGCDTTAACKHSPRSETQTCRRGSALRPEKGRDSSASTGSQVLPVSSNIRMFLHRHYTAHMCLVPVSSKKEAFQAQSTQPCQTQQSLLETTWHTLTSLLWAARWESMCMRKQEEDLKVLPEAVH